MTSGKTPTSTLTAIPLPSDIRPTEFQMRIHSGMLETMGHNMYSSVAKCLAEFVANAYDADSENVYITMNFEGIEAAKKKVRAAARNEKNNGERTDISAIYDPLPTDITITITDDGHGMSAREIQDYFLSITRNRREDEFGKPSKIYTESGKRRVMGRKGVGKLAGFGAAEHIRVTSKRTGQTYSTTFEMDYGEIKGNKDLANARFSANYKDGLNVDEHYTIITLSQLRCDSMKSTRETIRNTLSRTFCVLDKDFKVHLNDELIQEMDIDWEFTWPTDASEINMANSVITIDADDPDGKFPIKYLIRFRARADDHDADEKTRKRRGSLPAERRGARIYSHGRLTHGPSLLNLHSGVHNFHAQDYMECIVLADAIDEFDYDFIVTSREGLNKDNPVVNALFNHVTELMRQALSAHYKFRDQIIDTAIEHDDFSKGILSPLSAVNSKSQKAARQILKVIGKEHGLRSKTYKEMAPIMLQAVNASEVLTKLIELESDPKSIPVLAHSMAELARMEKSDLLKLYRGRCRAISALYKLHTDSMQKRKGKGYENELHSLFKESPWLIRPEFGSFITSDKPMGQLCATLNKVLSIDDVVEDDLDISEDATRPDLVFLATDSPNPDEIVIVELKSPGIELEMKHLLQLEEYIMKVEEYTQGKLGKDIKTIGYLVGTRPPKDASAVGKRQLLKRISELGPMSQYRVVDILELIANAQNIHRSGIEIFEAEEKQLQDELN